MPVTVSYPGVYLQEVPVQTPTVVAATTSNAAVIDFFRQGPVGQAVQVTSLNQFNNTFGGVDERSEGSYAVQQFFLNGGSLVWVVRVAPENAAAAYADFGSLVSSTYYVEAINPGEWGNLLAVNLIFQKGTTVSDTTLYTLQVGQWSAAGKQYAVVETYYSVSLDPKSPQFVANLVNGVSQYVTIVSSGSLSPLATLSPVESTSPADWVALSGGSDGDWDSDGADFKSALIAQVTAGSAALDSIAPQVFNILMIPAAAILPATGESPIYTAAMEYCLANQAFLLVDPPPPSAIQSNSVQVQDYHWISKVDFVNSVGTTDTDSGSLLLWSSHYVKSDAYSGATYYPWLTIPDPLNNFNPRLVAPSGTMAGIYATNDLNFGVWNAPAGTNAVLQGANLSSILTDTDSGNMNPQGLNALRSFPIYGNISWGARTLAGANLLQSTFKYINVRRLTDFVEQSLYQSLKWAVFQPNAAPLWASITAEVTAFMAGLFSQGAFQGTSASQAYFVQCGPSTTTQQDILNGIVNVVVGFAPVLPAEFVILQIQVQLTPFSAAS